MKNVIKYFALPVLAILLAGTTMAQDRSLQYFTYPDQRGVNQFEAPFYTDVEFEGVNVRIGGSNALQFQSLQHENDANSLTDLESNFNLATSNLDLDVGLAPGMRMHLRTYLSSQHHTETYVKGGYLQIDRLDFIEEDFMSDIMDNVRIKLGHMEINYGDNHFRRSDNAFAIHNPFVGNYIMDSFTTEVAGELYYYTPAGLMGMLGVSNGKLNQTTAESAIKTKPTVYGKLGFDTQLTPDLRFRLMGSILNITQSPSIYLYAGDRAGSRYYNVIEEENFRAGRFAPSFTPGRGEPAAAGEMTAIMINPFIKYGGLEFYGVYENTSGKIKTEEDRRTFNQYAGELLYRFGSSEDFYLGGRYNVVNGETNAGDIEIKRYNLGGGWFMTKNVLAKLEYVNQNYEGEGYTGSVYEGAEFNGVVLEAIISF